MVGMKITGHVEETPPLAMWGAGGATGEQRLYPEGFPCIRQRACPCRTCLLCVCDSPEQVPL